MDGVEEKPAPRFEIDEVMLEALRREGGPLILTHRGEEVAALLTTQELEAVEDKIDSMVASERMAAWEAAGRPPLPTLEEVVDELGIKPKAAD